MHISAQIIRSTMLLALCLSLSGCTTIGVAQLGHGVRETNNKGEVQKDDKREAVWVENPRPVYYMLIPFTVAVDIAFAPVTLPLLFAMRDVH
jgi:uncharacterized protein YceK